MLSRRSVRVKVMQLLYTQDRDSSIKEKELYKAYNNYIDQSYELFLFSLFVIEKICQRAIEDMKKRKAKHLPSEYDKHFTEKLYTNEIISAITSNNYLKRLFEKKDFPSKINQDYIARIYETFSKKEEYRKYIEEKTEQDHEAHLQILLEMYRFCRQNEYFNEILEDSYYNWLDDKSLVVGAVKKYLKGIPDDNEKLVEEFMPDDETVKEFGLNLLDYSLKNKETYMSNIIPVLENWDHERLALVDTILLRLAICEMLEFPTIPAKVTLNEYVELAKQYSTAKSKEFINGILDKLMKDLEKDGKLNKKGRGLAE